MRKFFTKKLLILPAIVGILISNTALAFTPATIDLMDTTLRTSRFLAHENQSLNNMFVSGSGIACSNPVLNTRAKIIEDVGNLHNTYNNYYSDTAGSATCSGGSFSLEKDFVFASPLAVVSGSMYIVTFEIYADDMGMGEAWNQIQTYQGTATGYFNYEAPAGGGEEGGATPMFTIPTSTAPNIMQKATEAFSATLIIFALVVGLPVAFWVINQFIDIFPKPKSHKKRRN